VRFWLPRVLPITLAFLILIEVIVTVPQWEAALVVVVAAWMALPGVWVARTFVGRRERSPIAAWLIGPALGFGFSVFGLLLLWAAGLQSWVALLLAPGFAWLVAACGRRFGMPPLRLPVFSRRDVTAVAATLLVVPAITWLPYDHVAEPVQDGQAYRAYFTADFVWAMAATAELAKGEVPPANPFLRGQPMRYYWMSHLLSGAIYRNVRGFGVTVEEVVLIDGLAFSMAFVAFLYGLARIAGGSPAWCAAALIVGFTANSYEAVNRLWILYQQGAPFDLVKTLNIDAVTRWFYQGMPVDGLQRLFLYQPHHLTGYVMALSALWLASFADDVRDTGVALWSGILLGLAFLFSTFTAIIVGVAVGVVFAVRLVAQRALGAAWQCAILGAGPILVAIAISSVLGYTDPKEGFLISFGINPVALRRWPLMFLLSFGPLLFAGIGGLLRFRWVARDGLAPAALVVAAIAFYFLADVPDMGGVWVGWRSGHLLLISFAIIGAAALTAAWQRYALRIPLGAAMVIAVGLAVPTVAIDVYNAQDITNRGPGPNFPWTLVITPPEREALNWIKRATPATAIVQVDPIARGATHWAYVPAFAERRMAAGIPISMIPLRPYERESAAVQSIFRAATADDARALAVTMGIDYLLIGAVERSAYIKGVTQIAERPDLFAPVFHNDAVDIYGVRH
jgi:hypothetical protein